MSGKSRPFPGFTAIPRGRRLVVIVWVFVAIVVTLLTAAVYSVELLSAGRAFVGAEGQWSRSQKDAAFYLSRYALTSDDADYKSFERALAVAGIIVSQRFVAQSERLQEMLRESESQLRHLIESAPLPLLVVRASDQQMLYGNERALQQFSLNAETLQGRTLSEFHAEPE